MKAEALRYSKSGDAVSLMAGIKKLMDPKVSYWASFHHALSASVSTERCKGIAHSAPLLYCQRHSFFCAGHSESLQATSADEFESDISALILVDRGVVKQRCAAIGSCGQIHNEEAIHTGFESRKY